jgi:hypothetical protein
MFQFLHDNHFALIGMGVMVISWLILDSRSYKNDAQSIDKKRIEKGMTPMTDEEKQIIHNVLRSSGINNFIAGLISGVVALVVAYFLLGVPNI